MWSGQTVSAQTESDLRLALDWHAFYWLPSDVFGAGKVLVFGEVLERDGTPYAADIRSRLRVFVQRDMLTSAGNHFKGQGQL